MIPRHSSKGASLSHNRHAYGRTARHTHDLISTRQAHASISNATDSNGKDSKQTNAQSATVANTVFHYRCKVRRCERTNVLESVCCINKSVEQQRRKHNPTAISWNCRPNSTVSQQNPVQANKNAGLATTVGCWTPTSTREKLESKFELHWRAAVLPAQFQKYSAPSQDQVSTENVHTAFAMLAPSSNKVRIVMCLKLSQQPIIKFCNFPSSSLLSCTAVRTGLREASCVVWGFQGTT